MPVTVQTSGAALDTVTWNTITTAAAYKIMPKLWPQFLTSVPILALIKSKNQVVTQGGELIKVDVQYGEGGEPIAFSQFQNIPLSSVDDSMPTRLQWRNLAKGVAVSWEDQEILKAQNMGAQVDILSRNLDWCMRGMKRYVNKILWEDGSGQNGQVMLGIDAWVDTTPTTGVIAGIDRAVDTWFQNQSVNANGTWSNNGIMGATNDYPLALVNDLTDGVEKPQIIFSHPDMAEYYERSLPQIITVNTNAGQATDLGFPTLKYKNMPWYTDRQCPNGRLYFLNMDFWQFYVSGDANFKVTPWKDLSASGVLGSCSFVILRSNLACMSPMRQGVIYGYTTFK